MQISEESRSTVKDQGQERELLLYGAEMRVIGHKEYLRLLRHFSALSQISATVYQYNKWEKLGSKNSGQFQGTMQHD